MNTKRNHTLSKIHFALVIFYALIGVCLLLSVSHSIINSQKYIGLVILAGFSVIPMALHFIAMKGAASGVSWGRSLSRTVGILMLLAFPIGTVIGALLVYFSKPSKWESS